MKRLDKRGDILRAAMELITERGFHGAPMAEIAKKAGVAAGTIYLYFESKDVLINELHRDLEERITVILQSDFPAKGSVREKFLHLVRGMLHYFIAHPLHFRYMEQYFNSPYGVCLHRERLLARSGNNDIMMDIFDQGILEKVLKDLPVAALFSLALAPQIFLLRDHVLGFIKLEDVLIQQATEACWDAIKR